MSGPSDAHFSNIDGRPCVDFGDASLYMPGEWNVNRGRWRLCLRDHRTPPIRMSSWIALDDITDLWSSHKAAIIREEVRAEYGDLWRRRLDRVIHVFQEERDHFIVEAEVTEETPQSQEVVEEPSLTPEEEEEVLLILTSPRGQEYLKHHLDNIIAGEDQNKLLIFYLLLSGKSVDKKLKQMIILTGTSGSGKTTLMSIADAFNTKDIGRFTRHALDYSELAGFEVLRLKEFGSMDAEEQGVSTIKFLSADDKGYIVEYPVRDKESGELVNVQKRIEPIAVISSTTRAELDSQYMRRNWPIEPDESPEQTERVRQWKVRHENEMTEIALGRRVETSYDRSMRILKALVQRIEMCEVVIPFPDTLTAILRAIDIANIEIQLRVRGDYDKLLTLVKLYGIFQQNQLPSIRQNDRRIVFMLPEKALEVIHIAERPLTRMMTGKDSKVQKILNILSSTQWDFVRPGVPIDKKLRDQIGKLCGWVPHTTLVYFNQIEDLGFLTSEKKGNTKIHELVYQIDEIQEKIGVISSKLRNDGSLIAQMWEEGLNTLSRLSSSQNPGDGGIYNDTEGPSTFEPVLEVFRSRKYISPSRDDRNDDEGLTDNLRQNRELTGLNRHLEEMTENRVYCYHCRRDITEERKFNQQVDDRDVLVCAECFGEGRRVLLSERLQMLRDVLDDVFRDSQDQPVTASTILGYLEDRFPDDLWTEGTLEQIIKLAIRDGLLFESRPGFYLRM